MEPHHPANTLLSLLLLLISCSFFLFGVPLPHATDSIRQGRSVSGNGTLVSGGGKFVLGFFSPGNSHNYYVGIWYGKIPERTVIWVANREVPLPSLESAELKISEDGNLVLLNHRSKVPIWSSKPNATFPRSSRVAVLLDTGNFVLKESLDSPAFIWQSFDHPTDTWVPGSGVGLNKLTGEYQILTSWKSSEDPSPGIFSHRIDPGGSSDYLTLWNGSLVYDRTGEWDGHSFRRLPQPTVSLYFRIIYVETKERKYITNGFNVSLLVRLVLDVSGQIKLCTWLENEQKWMLIMSRPESQCDVYSVCGAFGVCNQMNFHACSCLPGFEPKSLKDWNLHDWSGGCVRKSSLQYVGNNTVDVFHVMPEVKLPTGSQNLPVADAEECKSACLCNCSCSAYAYDGTCQIWNGELHNLQQLSGADGNSGTLYLRLSAQEQSHSGGRKKIAVAAILGSILGFLTLSSIVVISIVRIRRSWRGASATLAPVMDGSLFQFRYSVLHQITKKFSVQLGRGGFGRVFVGELPDSTMVAVKRLEGLMQGEKQFRAEVRTLGTVQHVNLVRLRGFCSDGDRRLLVYDYMPNGSLDAHLFRTEPPYLSWTRRYQIALGTARGLTYLHEECREQIIHCDIKPENILLDESYQPKVADFGMAKLVARDFTRVLTTMRGTIGYLAPEWISGLAITPKVDVYSFGMMLFELISGRRNTEMGVDGRTTYFPLLAARTIIEGGDVLCLLDHRLGGDVDVEELARVCRAACRCIQDEESERPTMGQVIQILEGVRLPDVPCIPSSLLYFLGSGNDSYSM